MSIRRRLRVEFETFHVNKTLSLSLSLSLSLCDLLHF